MNWWWPGMFDGVGSWCMTQAAASAATNTPKGLAPPKSTKTVSQHHNKS